MTTNIRYLC